MRKNKVNKSLESALDEERAEVMALLEGRSLKGSAKSKTAVPRAGSRDHRNKLRTASPAGIAQSPVRSMLDLSAPAPVARPGSLASPQSPTFPRSAVRSMLDPGLPSASPTTAHPPQQGRSLSSPIVPQSHSEPGSPEPSLEDQYKFDVGQQVDGQALPRGHGEGELSKRKTAMSQVYGTSSSEFGRPRHNSTSNTLGEKRPQSPSSRLDISGRSMSPAQRGVDTSRLTNRTKYFNSTTGKVIDMSNAYRRLSDANLIRSGGKLANPKSKRAVDAEKGESRAPDGGVRLEKDYFADADNDNDEDEEDALDDSDSGSDWQSEGSRGRQRERAKHSDAEEGDSPDSERRPKSLLAAAEDERLAVQSQRYKSLIPETITVTDPSGEKVSARKANIHPNTSFDDAASRVSTPINSDDEADISDIRRAQRMGLSVSPVHSTPESHRCLRQIIRGDYDDLVKEAEKGLRRQRMYLVATDLSDEAAYALEWTIGTCLRDGDTLLAVYAIDEDQIGEGIGVAIGEGADMMHDTARELKDIELERKVTNDNGFVPQMVSPLGKDHGTADGQEPDWDKMDKAERERWHATIEVGDRCVKLLRKTRLQVRVVVEVFHCKSPKHMITEVIDHLEPTLVVLGSRGRSALKGVLLGSFSNYLVTKSSVPVMVARKRLRKHSKYKRQNLRLSNMLQSPGRGKLELAKID